LLDFPDLDDQLNPLLGAPHWCVGYSGGVDSTVLLHLLHRWRAAHPGAPALSALHINHGLQSAAEAWQRHCEELCRSLRIPILPVAVHVPAGGEAAARDARYRAFSRQLRPGAVLFLGHHLDDQVETFFLRLLRGAGVEGLAAMPRRRALGDGELVRPLLDVSRGELEDYAARHRLAYVVDPSNRNTAMDRNFLRLEVLPLLASRWPAYRQSVARASAHLARAALALDDVPATVHSVLGDPGLPLDAVVDGAGGSGANRVRAWLRARGCRVPDHAPLAEFLRQLQEAGGDGRPKLACGDYSLQRYRDAVFLLPVFDAPPPAQAFDLAPGERRDIPGVGAVSLVRSESGGVRLGEDDCLTVRWRQGGERCRLPGRSGGHSLKAVLQELHVPPWWRDRVPLVYLQDELLVIGELQRCDSARWLARARTGEPLWRVNWERPRCWPGSD